MSVRCADGTSYELVAIGADISGIITQNTIRGEWIFEWGVELWGPIVEARAEFAGSR